MSNNDAFDELNRKDKRLLTAISVAGYTPEGSDDMLFGGAYDKLVKRAEKRGLDLSLAPEYDTQAEALSDVGKLSHVTGFSKSGALQKAGMRVQLAQQEREQARRDESIKLAEDAIKAFNEDKSYETLINNIRNLPATLSDEDVARLRRINAQRARNDEVQRLRQIRATSGLRGIGGENVAAQAERAAANADAQVASAFNQIALEKISQDRKDLIQQTLMEADIMERRKMTLLQLQQNYRAAVEGGFLDLSQPLDEYSAFLEAEEARALAEELARERNRTALTQAYIGAGTAIAGDLITGLPSWGGGEGGGASSTGDKTQVAGGLVAVNASAGN